MMRGALVRRELTPRRMLNTHEAAYYCGLSAYDFKAACPVKPVYLTRGQQSFDMTDLDRWIESKKAHGEDAGLAEQGGP